MRKHKNNLGKQKKRNIGLNYSGKMPIEEKLIVKCIRTAEKIIMAVSIIIAIILVILAEYNEMNCYVWFDKKDTLILYILSAIFMFVCAPLTFILEIIAKRLD